jgi:lysophospholipase L1-like esterase
MSRAGTVILALAAVTCALAAALPASGAQKSRTLLDFGDSLAVGTGLFLSGVLPGWTVSESTSISRHAYEGPAGLRAFGPDLPRVVLVSLGTNDDPGTVSRFSGYVRDVVRIAGPSRCVIWSTIVRPPYNGVSYDGYNNVLRRAARAYPNLVLLDWQALAHGHPRWLGSDGVHPSADGYRARAAAVTQVVKSSPS